VSADLVDYYARRAREYEAVYSKPERQADLERIREWLRAELRGHAVLEIACGTGYWTQWLAPVAGEILGTDACEPALDVARRKSYPVGRVRFAVADAYDLSALPGRFTAAFAGFFFSHVPRSRAGAFLDGLHLRMGPGARVVLLDNRYVEGSSTPISRTDEEGNTYQRRRLNDRTEHEVLKNFPATGDLRALLEPRVSSLGVVEFDHYWGAAYTTVPIR